MPLFVSHLSEIEHCIGRNMRRYDFMRGAADSHKREYACESEPMYVVRIWRHPLERWLSKLKWAARGQVKRLWVQLQSRRAKQ